MLACLASRARAHPLGSVVLILALLVLGGCRATSPSSVEDPPAGQPLVVGFLVVDGVYNSELMAPWDVFQHTIFHTQPGMRVVLIAPTRDVVTSFEGLRLLPDHGFDDAPELDVLVVPSCEHSMDSDLEDRTMIEWVAEVGGRADYVMSLCDGAFVLAQAGLLDGLECTTFPSDIPAFRERFSEPRVIEGVSFVHDGKAITSAGGAKSYDPAMYLCERLYGAAATRGIGGGLLIDWDVSRIPHVAPEAEAVP